jgi:site-specific DNA-cytosine methylase
MTDVKPIVFDLYCGLGGFSEPFITEGFRAIGFDVEHHDYGSGDYLGELILQDVRTISGYELVKKYGVPAVIVASPPCQEFSYLAMPWKRGKQIAAALLGKGEFPKGYKGSRTVAEMTDLFNQCFRIQHEVSEAAGRYVPIIVENVRGAQRWVGRSRWNFASFHLWGDVPALMPIPAKAHLKIDSPHLWLSDPNRAGGKFASNYTKGEGRKTADMNWSDQTKRGQDFTRIAGLQNGTKLPGNNSPRRWDKREVKRLCDAGTKTVKDSDGGYGGNFGWDVTPLRRGNSKSSKRKQASAEIAKIPYPLAQWLARTFKPK